MNFKPNFEKKKNSDSAAAVKKYAPISKFMVTKLITFQANAELTEVVNTLIDKNISGAPVLNDNGELIGVIDDKDCLHTFVDSVYHNVPIRKKQVKSYMTDVYKTININMDIIDAANEFLKSNYKRLLVVDDNGKLKGQITRGDMLKAMKEVDGTNWRQQN